MFSLRRGCEPIKHARAWDSQLVPLCFSVVPGTIGSTLNGNVEPIR